MLFPLIVIAVFRIGLSATLATAGHGTNKLHILMLLDVALTFCVAFGVWRATVGTRAPLAEQFFAAIATAALSGLILRFFRYLNRPGTRLRQD